MFSGFSCCVELLDTFALLDVLEFLGVFTFFFSSRVSFSSSLSEIFVNAELLELLERFELFDILCPRFSKGDSVSVIVLVDKNHQALQTKMDFHHII